MAPRSMPVLTQHVAVAANEMRDRIAAQPVGVDLLPAVQFTALEIAGRSMFSLEMAERGGPMRALLMKFAVELARPSPLDMLFPSAPSLKDGARRRFRTAWMALIGGIVDARARLPQSDGPRDLFDLLQAARDPETGAAFTREQLCDQVATMILAGHETTALTLFWSLALLAQSPEWQDRAAAEATAAPFTPDGAADALAALPVTRAIVSEALRLYPPAFMITREPVARDVAHGTLIPRGATVAIAPWVLHRHSLLWEAPHSFDPARFMPDAPPPRRFAYLPFGAGPRICVAAQFAMAEAVLVLATVLQAFHVSSADVAVVRPIARVTTQPDRPAHFTFEPRMAAARTQAAA